jgi:hypothetical protein
MERSGPKRPKQFEREPYGAARVRGEPQRRGKDATPLTSRVALEMSSPARRHLTHK